MKFQIYPDKGGKWRWRIKRNGRITACSGESFASKGNAKRALMRFYRSIYYHDGLYPANAEASVEVVKK